MIYFGYLNSEERKRIFFKEPESFNIDSERDILQYAVGALLYVPAIKSELLDKCLNGNVTGMTSFVICLEDSVGLKGEEEAVLNLSNFLTSLKNRDYQDNPLIFIRPRDVKQFKRISSIVEENKEIISGIVIPKANGDKIISIFNILNDIDCRNLYVMPIIETDDFIKERSKNECLEKFYISIREYRDRILNVRLGVTDILGIYGVRRDKKFNIYDNLIFNKFSLEMLTMMNELNIPVSGCVSEFYDMEDQTIFDSYVNEIRLDKFNGFCGKTVIHPMQLKIVQAMSVINYEDYIDAIDIINNIESKHAITASINKERMNEVNPHLKWARKILRLSKIYGVFNKGMDYYELYRLSLQY